MSWFGGKGQDGVYQTIINQIPPHDVNVELFCGGGSVMAKTGGDALKIGFDLDSDALQECKNNCPEAHLFQRSAFDVLDRLLIANDVSALKRFNIPFAEQFISQQVYMLVDPPYLHETRKSTKRYKFELSRADHESLLEYLKELSHFKDFHIAVTHYPCDLYDKTLMHWRTVDFQSVDRAGNVRDERLYMNYPEPTVLHDSRYLGQNKDQRQRIKRKITNYVSKFNSWSPQERARAIGELLPVLTREEKAILTTALQDS